MSSLRPRQSLATEKPSSRTSSLRMIVCRYTISRAGAYRGRSNHHSRMIHSDKKQRYPLGPGPDPVLSCPTSPSARWQRTDTRGWRSILVTVRERKGGAVALVGLKMNRVHNHSSDLWIESAWGTWFCQRLGLCKPWDRDSCLSTGLRRAEKGVVAE